MDTLESVDQTKELGFIAKYIKMLVVIIPLLCSLILTMTFMTVWISVQDTLSSEVEALEYIVTSIFPYIILILIIISFIMLIIANKMKDLFNAIIVILCIMITAILFVNGLILME